MLNSTKVKGAAVAVTVLAITITAAGPARADQQPRAKDAVGVGSDTVQYVSDFLDDGDINANPVQLVNTARRVAVRRHRRRQRSHQLQERRRYGAQLQIALRAGSKPVTRPAQSVRASPHPR